MAVTSGYFNSVNGDRKYNADQMSEYFEGIINEGVCQHIDGGLAVTAGTGLSVSVAAGKAFIGQKWIRNDAALTLTIGAASTSYARIDAVVIRRNNSTRTCEIAVKAGTPAASPEAPSMTRTDATYEMALAYVNVAANATSVTVTDKRADTTVCGWATVAQSTSGEVDQMLNDMKTGFDGVVYPSPAAQVIGSDTKLQGEIDKMANGQTRINTSWAIGNINSTTGLYDSSVNYRVATTGFTVPAYDFIMTIASGYRVYPYYFDENDNLILKVGWVSGSYTIPAGQKFTMVIQKYPESSSTPVSDISEFVNAVTIPIKTSSDLAVLRAEVIDGSNYGVTLNNSLNIRAQDANTNTNYYIKSTGEVTSTTSAIGVSNLFRCIPGDKIKFSLSSGTGYLVFAVYDKNGALTHYTTATGYANIITEEYTFAVGDFSFRVSGTVNYIDSYSIEYSPVPYKIADLQNRVADLEAGDVQLPAYWKAYLPDKIKAIQLKDALVGDDGDSFVFITDVHLATNTKYSPDIIRNIIDSTSVNKVFNGGDTLDEGVLHDNAIYDLFTWQKLMHGIRQYNVVGNHDNNNYNSQNPANKIEASEFYGVMDKPAEQWIDTDGKLYFVVDNESMKMRYIVVCNAAFGGDADISQNPQKAWLESKLTEKDSTWAIIVFQHYLWGSSTASIHAQGQAVIDIINGVYSSINADFIGIIAGHTHTDYSTTESVNGYLLIATNCDTRSGSVSGYDRTAGTVNEQSFDIFHVDKLNKHLYATRIGAGSNRDWSYS